MLGFFFFFLIFFRLGLWGVVKAAALTGLHLGPHLIATLSFMRKYDFFNPPIFAG